MNLAAAEKYTNFLTNRKGVHNERRIKSRKIIEKMDLKILTPDIDVGSKVVMVPDINRPALQLAGFLTILITKESRL